MHKAQERSTGRYVALKKVRMENEKEGFPMTALREIRILQLLKHENVMELIEICRSRGTYVCIYFATCNYLATVLLVHSQDSCSIYLVCEFCEHDLAGLLSNPQVKFSLGEIKKLLQQLFNGMYYIHHNRILHRDMKASNILITKNGVLKLADFGLARAISTSKGQQRYTNRVVTLWYRPPELLLGERNYGPAIDMWGAGCIMAEMWTRSPVMQGNTEQHQITLISQLCGSITTEVWPNVDKLELFGKLDLPKDQNRKIRDRLRHYIKDSYAIDLLDKLLILDPSKRIDSNDALNHDFFWEAPIPEDPAKTLSQYKTSMYEMHVNKRHAGARAPPPSNAPAHSSNDISSTMTDRVY